MALFSAVSEDDMQMARIVTGVTMALFIATMVTPGLRRRATAIRFVLLGVYLVACVVFVGYVMLR